MAATETLRTIPSVDSLLRRNEIKLLAERVGQQVLTDELRSVLDELRREILGGRVFSSGVDLLGEIERRTRARVIQADQPSLRRVINASGVIIHTNLGRAPLGKGAIEAIQAVAPFYSNLEYDLDQGGRGKREVHCQKLLKKVLGVESALVVNNNACAVLLVLNELAEGGEVIVSRGELVEIGGSFRMPDVMAKSGGILREVGTTNRTRLSDYEKAITDQTRLIVRVHRSNFKIVGFTEQPELGELVELAHRHGLPCYEDLGSGCLVDLARWGLKGEPTVQHSLSAGVDVCSFSGDKLLGGPQAGVIVGREELVTRIGRNPLMRALRPDKLTFAALEATLRAYLRGRADEDIPVIKMISAPALEIKQRARRFIRSARKNCRERFQFSLLKGFSVTGGGSAPEVGLETYLIALEHSTLSANELESKLRRSDPPIITRVEANRVVIDLRTVLPEEEKVIIASLSEI
jgi:L-seryl-tRNA(Ser) seleniumtransferase